jgi:glutamate-5-semialdehyde dehydrogenase
VLQEIGKKAKLASKELAKLSTNEKNNILNSIKNSITKNREKIVKNNELDMQIGKENNLSAALLDRLLLDDKRVNGLLDSIDYVISLDDPIGKIESMKTMANGLIVGSKTTPMGVLGIIYESRPNVTLDCALLCIKSSNALILKGGKEAINTNIAIEESIREGIKEAGFNPNFVQLIKDNTRKMTEEFMRLNEYLDVLIPRGSGRLIKSVSENANVPVITTGEGNCHVYIDESADINMALSIIENAKTQRTGVCNAMETLLVHSSIEDDFYKGLEEIIRKHNIKVYGCKRSKMYLPFIEDATEAEYDTEFLDMAFAMKIVDSVEEAIEHIGKYSTGHSESIVTNKYTSSQKFLDEVDSACVYVNASTRFTDGGELGMGAEMGISTQKLHARGPIGLEQLTSKKYIIYGQGQIRQ